VTRDEIIKNHKPSFSKNQNESGEETPMAEGGVRVMWERCESDQRCENDVRVTTFVNLVSDVSVIRGE